MPFSAALVFKSSTFISVEYGIPSYFLFFCLLHSSLIYALKISQLNEKQNVTHLGCECKHFHWQFMRSALCSTSCRPLLSTLGCHCWPVSLWKPSCAALHQLNWWFTLAVLLPYGLVLKQISAFPVRSVMADGGTWNRVYKSHVPITMAFINAIWQYKTWQKHI